jgi:hypothetical protein
MSEPQVKILDKALRVLMLFSPEQPEWGVSAVSREVGMSKSTGACWNLVLPISIR